MFQFLGEAREFSKDSSLLEHYILPSQVIVRWVRAFCQGQVATNDHLQSADSVSVVAAGIGQTLDKAPAGCARYNQQFQCLSHH